MRNARRIDSDRVRAMLVIGEQEALRVELELAFEPRPALLQDIGSVLLGRACGLGSHGNTP